MVSLATDSGLEVFAMKILKSQKASSETNNFTISPLEHEILSDHTHPFLLSLKYSYKSQSKLYMITEYCAGGELFFHLKKFQYFTESK